MRKFLRTQAFVLKKKPMLEKNLRLTLFTQKYGKMALFAYGIKSIKSRRLSHIETGNLIEAIIEERKEGYYLKESQLISSFFLIKKNPPKLRVLYLFLFILDRLLPENQKEEKAYWLTYDFYKGLAKMERLDKKFFFKYSNKLLITLGYLEKELKSEELLSFVEDLINEEIPSFIRV